MTEGPPEYNAERALVPVEERVVDFYGDEIKGGIVIHPPSEQEVYVPVRPLVDFLGVDWRGQRQRIQRDPVLSEEVRMVVLDTPGGPQEMMCLPLDFLNGWLFGISASRVREDIRDRVIRYQRECYKVLAAAFQEPPVGDPLSQVEDLGHALITLAREQRAFDRRLTNTEDTVEDVTQRVVALEDRLAPGNPITEEQATQLSQAVKAVALALGKQTRRNEFGAIYGELYRRYGINSYKLLPTEKFEDAMSWLNQWLQELMGEEPF